MKKAKKCKICNSPVWPKTICVQRQGDIVSGGGGLILCNGQRSFVNYRPSLEDGYKKKHFANEGEIVLVDIEPSEIVTDVSLT